MFVREELIWAYAEDLEPTEMVYRTEDVSEVMDRMEARIKELEDELRKQANLKNYYKENCEGVAAELRKLKGLG